MFEIKLTIDASPALLKAVEAITGALTAPQPLAVLTATETVAPPAAKAKAPAKAVASAPPVEEVAVDVEAEVVTAGKTYTIEEVRALVHTKATDGKRDQVKALLGEFEVARVTELTADQFTPFMAKVIAL